MSQYFTFSPHEDGRPIVLDGKAIAYVEEDAPPMTGEILASAQDAREKLEELALYLQSSLRLKGCRKAEKLAEDALDLLARSLNPKSDELIQADEATARTAFERATAAGILSADEDAENFAGAFMFMGALEEGDAFKHIGTRRYIYHKPGEES